MIFLLRWVFIFSLFATTSYAQVINDQDWNTNVSLASDTLTISCSEFILPSDVGRLLDDADPISDDTGEFSQSLRSSHFIKVTLQPESGVSDTLSTISGCTIDGTLLLLKTHDSGDTITIDNAGNISPPGGSVSIADTSTLYLFVLYGSTYYLVGAVSSGSGTGKVITDAVDAASAFTAGDGTSYCKIWGESNKARIECTCNSDPCPPEFVIPSGETLRISNEAGTNYIQFGDDAEVTFAGLARPYGMFEWTAGNLAGDGTQCDADPSTITVNSEPKGALHCDMGGTETPGTIYSWVGIPIPANFDKTADITVTARGWLITDSGAGTKYGNIAISCRPAQEAPGSYGTAVDLNFTMIAADAVNDMIVATGSSSLDTDTTGVDCDEGDLLYFKYISCDTDTTPPTGCSNSVGFENDLDIFSFEFVFRETSLDKD